MSGGISFETKKNVAVASGFEPSVKVGAVEQLAPRRIRRASPSFAAAGPKPTTSASQLQAITRGPPSGHWLTNGFESSFVAGNREHPTTMLTTSLAWPPPIHPWHKSYWRSFTNPSGFRPRSLENVIALNTHPQDELSRGKRVQNRSRKNKNYFPNLLTR